jgi:hypothetical protein
MVADPGVMPVMVTVAVVAPLATFTVDGTVAAAGLEEVSDTDTPPAGAGGDSVRVRFCVPGAVIVTVDGEKLIEAPTLTCVV